MEPQYREHVLYHELAHLMMSHLGQGALNDDEKFIDGLAGLMHQFNKSKKGKA